MTMDSEQLTTFYIGRDLFGIEVMQVQEVSINPQIVRVPLAPDFVLGLINLRGQIATALGLRELFGGKPNETGEKMSVVCKIDGNLVSLVVDSIGDVIEVKREQFESAPDTLPGTIRRYIKGIYKLNGVLLSVLDTDMLAKELSPSTEVAFDKKEFANE